MRTTVFFSLALLLCSTASAQDAPALTPRSLEAALAARPQGAEAEKLAERIRAYFGADALSKGSAAPKIEDLMVAWAVELPPPAADAPPARVVSDAVHFTMPLTRVGSGGLYAGVATLAHGEAFTWHFEAGDRRLGGE